MDDADDATVARHLEAYILWLFGWIMFCSSQGDSCPKQLVPVARAIADAPLDMVPSSAGPLPCWLRRIGAFARA